MICNGYREVELAKLIDGQIVCQKCDRLISIVDTRPMADWIEQEVARKKELLDSGELRTRIQTTDQNDQEIDRDGLHAEFATCLALCPHRIAFWKEAAASNQKNRGRDVPTEWTGLLKPIEIKFTRYFSGSKGYLLIRPPSGKGRDMKPEFVDDAVYVLITLAQGDCKIIGWIDRDGFIEKKEVDPVGRKGNQVECWGVLWKNLNGLSKLPRTEQINCVNLESIP